MTNSAEENTELSENVTHLEIPGFNGISTNRVSFGLFTAERMNGAEDGSYHSTTQSLKRITRTSTGGTMKVFKNPASRCIITLSSLSVSGRARKKA